MICIICRKETNIFDFSLEHIVPDAIGGHLTIKSVCKKCNSRLGTTVDSKLSNNFIVNPLRCIHGLAGKKGRIPNLFNDGVLDSDKSQVVQFRGMKPHLVPKRVENDDGTVSITASSTEEATKIAQKILKRKGVKDISDSSIEKRTKERVKRKFQPIVHTQGSIDMTGIVMAIFKIAYEITWMWLGNDYLEDSQGKRIAEEIYMYSKTNNYSGVCDNWYKTPNKVGFKDFEAQIAPIFGFDPQDHLHSIILLREKDKLFCVVRILGIFEYAVLMSRDASEFMGKGSLFLSFQNPLTKESIEGSLIELATKVSLQS